VNELTEPGSHYPKQIRNLLLGIFLLATGLFLDFAQDFILPVLLGLLIAITFRPAIRILARRGIPEWLTATGFITLLVSAVATLVFVLAGPIASFVANAPFYSKIFAVRLQELKVSMRAMLRFAEQLQAATQPVTTSTAQEVVIRDGPPLAYLGQITGYSMSVVATIVLTLVIAAFFMASGDLFYAKLVRVLPTLRDKKTALRIVYDVEREVSDYLLIVTAINAILGMAVAAAFFALGMPSPLLWGTLAFALNFVPFIGAVVGIGMAAFMAVVTFDSFAYAMLIPLSYAALNGMENQFISPLMLGRRLQLNSVALLLALTFWTWIWGIAGTLVAVPLLVTIKVFCDHLDSLSGIGEFLSGRYPEDTPSQNDASAISTAVVQK
jgi:predicted PurR-regulated permease PerM